MPDLSLYVHPKEQIVGRNPLPTPGCCSSDDVGRLGVNRHQDGDPADRACCADADHPNGYRGFYRCSCRGTCRGSDHPDGACRAYGTNTERHSNT